jgi:phosphoglycerol transferase MdoB-like AlkP superfamily enzyme
MKKLAKLSICLHFKIAKTFSFWKKIQIIVLASLNFLILLLDFVYLFSGALYKKCAALFIVVTKLAAISTLSVLICNVCKETGDNVNDVNKKLCHSGVG